MAWKKIVVSGSTAQLSTLNVDSSIEASTLSGSFSGSYVGNGSGLTNLTIDQVATVTDTFTNQTSVATSHNFDTKNVQVQVFNSSDQLIIPATVTTTDADTVTTTFDSSTSGRVVIAKGGHIVSGSVEFTSIANKPTLLSGSGQIAVDISGSFVSASTALGTRIDNITSTITLAADNGSNDTYTTGETLTFTGDNSISTTVSDNEITFTIGDGIMSSSAQVVAAVEAGTDSNTFTDAESSKLAAIEAAADVTDTTNVTAAGALMDSELTAIASVKALNQGVATSDSPTFAAVTTTGDVTIAGDLNVTGDTIQASVTNLNVEDKFILINSGSNSGDTGIVFGGAGGSTTNTGDGIFYDDSDSVFAFAENIASNATSATNASKIGNIEVASANPSSAPTFQGIGSIHINDSTEGIWIYS
jgi:hypothetical protein